MARTTIQLHATTELAGDGTVTLDISADLAALPAEERKLVYELLDVVGSFPHAAAEPVLLPGFTVDIEPVADLEGGAKASVEKELALLRVIDVAGGRIDDDKSAAQVAIERAELNKATGSRILIKLAEADDIDRYVNERGWVTTLELTDKGRARLREAS